MSKYIVFALLLPLLLSSCFSMISYPEAPQRELFFKLKNSVGDTLCYKRSLTGIFPDRDTIHGYSIWTITKDTAILLDTFLVYDGVEYLEGHGTIDTLFRKMLVKQDAYGVECFDLNLGYIDEILIGGPLRSTQELHKMSYNQLRTLFMPQSLRPTVKRSSTGDFYDHQYVLQYPLKEQKRWQNRDEQNQWDHRVISKICHGYDTLLINGSRLQTLMTEVLLREQVTNKDLMLFQWYDTLGIYKELHGYGKFITKDDYEITPYEMFHRVHYSQVDLSSLRPY